MHEFEALLYSDSYLLAKNAGIDQAKIDRILAEFNGPEDIDDDPQGAPSKRLFKLNSRYRKVAMGRAVTEAIGIASIRRRCLPLHFFLLDIFVDFQAVGSNLFFKIKSGQD